MERAFVVQIINSDNEAILMTENQITYTLPLSVLPFDIQENDFVIFDHGSIIIDPENQKIKESMLNSLKANMQK